MWNFNLKPRFAITQTSSEPASSSNLALLRLSRWIGNSYGSSRITSGRFSDKKLDRVWAKLICRQQAPQPEGRWSNICWSNSGAIDEYDDDDACEDECEDDNYLLKQLRRCQWMVNTSPHTWIVPITFAIRTVVDFKQFCWIQLHSDDNALINSLVLPLRIKSDESKLMLMEQNQVHIPKEKTHITYRYHPYSHTQKSLHCIGLPQQCWNFLIFPSYLDCFWIDSRLMQLGSISINSRLTLNGFHINSLKGNLIIMRSLFFLLLAGLEMVSWGDGADITFILIKVTFNAGKYFVKSFIRQKKLVLADHVPGVQDYSGMSLERLRAALQLLSEVFNKTVHKNIWML